MANSLIKSIIIHGLIIAAVITGYFWENYTLKNQSIKSIKVHAVNQQEVDKYLDSKKKALQAKIQVAKERAKALKNKKELEKPIHTEDVIKQEKKALKKLTNDAEKEKRRKQMIEKAKIEKEAEKQRKVSQDKAIKLQQELNRKKEAKKREEKERKRQAWLKKVEKRKNAKAKEQARLAKEKKMIEMEKLREQNNNSNSSPPNSGGNIDFADVDISQTEGTEMDAMIVKYSELIRKKMAVHWVRPIHTRSLDLKATVGIRLSNDGAIKLVRIIKTSGYVDFDLSVQNALWSAETLPIPRNPNFLPIFVSGELEMEFENF